VIHTHGLPRRYWIEVACAVLGTALFVLTLLVPEWIEAALSVDPDGGNVLLEIGISLAFVTTAVISSVLARREWMCARLADA